MCHIRSYFAIEREFDRYYQLLKGQLRDGTNCDDICDEDALQLAAIQTFDEEKIWPNPNIKIPLEKSHLAVTYTENPQIYEQLCIQQEEIQVTKKQNDTDITHSSVDILLSSPYEEWHEACRYIVAKSTVDPSRKLSFNLYLQSKPARLESRVIKEFMLGQKLYDQRAVKNVMTSHSLISMNESLLSRDTQLDHYAKVIENMKDLVPQEENEEELAISMSPLAANT